MTDMSEYLIAFIVLSSWFLYVTIILSKLRKHRKLFLSDWGFSFFQPMKNLFEYKKICQKENRSLIWFNVQVFLLLAFFLIAFVDIFSWNYK